jgi:AbrB family looped-hinge helix DNA binding protein
MVTKVSTKGQVVLPSQVRRRLGLEPGDTLDIQLEGERIVLVPRRKRQKKPRIIADPITGMPVLSAGPDAPIITSELVAELLKDFP